MFEVLPNRLGYVCNRKVLDNLENTTLSHGWTRRCYIRLNTSYTMIQGVHHNASQEYRPDGRKNADCCSSGVRIVSQMYIDTVSPVPMSRWHSLRSEIASRT
jgi:hypothetical protein